MSVSLTDAALRKNIAKLPQVAREDMWRELNDTAISFAISGATQEALAIWQFAYGGLVEMPRHDDLTISVQGDSAISAVCYQLGLEDLSKGVPQPYRRYLKAKLPLKSRVVAVDNHVRRDLTSDAWSSKANWSNLPPELVDVGNVRKARLLAQPRSGRTSKTKEKQAIKLLLSVLDKPEHTLPGYLEVEACLLAIDLLVRHDRMEEASDRCQHFNRAMVKQRSAQSAKNAFCLIPVARLLCEGTLSDRSKISPKERAQLVKKLIQDLTKRFRQPEPPKTPQWKHKLDVSYGQFYIEPLKADLAYTYFQVDGESEQGFSAFPKQIAIGTPDAYCNCAIEAEIREKMPPVGRAVQAVAVPLRVTQSTGVYLRTVDNSSNTMKLEIPKGRYDVLARFFPKKSTREASEYERDWRVVLSFLPSGTLGAKCLKLEHGTPPEEILLNR